MSIDIVKYIPSIRRSCPERAYTKKSNLTFFLLFIRVEGKVFNYQTWMVKIELDHRLVTTRILQSSHHAHTDTTPFNFKILLEEKEKRIQCINTANVGLACF